MLRINKLTLLFLTLSVMTIVFCSCGTAGNMSDRDTKGARANTSYYPESRTGTAYNSGNAYGNGTSVTGEAGSYNKSLPSGTVNGGDTVGNSVNSILGSGAVGEADGMTGTSTMGTNNTASSKTTYRTDGVNTNNGSADGGKSTSGYNSNVSSVNGINSRNAGGSGNPNYTK